MFSLWHVHKSLFGDFVLLLVSLVQVKTALQHWNQLLRGIFLSVPENIVIEHFVSLLRWLHCAISDLLVEENVKLALVNHLVSDFDEQTSHSFIGIVVPGDGMNHLDTVHQGRQGILDSLWGSIVKGFDELLKCRQVLDVVLGFVKSFSNSQFNASPLGGSQVNLVSRLSKLLSWVLRGLCKDIVDSSAVFASELLRNTGELSHLLSPELNLLSWSGLLVLTLQLLIVVVLDCVFNLFTPVVKDSFEISDHLWVGSLGSLNILCFVLPFSVVLFEL